jgi:hypothetical protein
MLAPVAHRLTRGTFLDIPEGRESQRRSLLFHLFGGVDAVDIVHHDGVACIPARLVQRAPGQRILIEHFGDVMFPNVAGELLPTLATH